MLIYTKTSFYIVEKRINGTENLYWYNWILDLIYKHRIYYLQFFIIFIINNSKCEKTVD